VRTVQYFAGTNSLGTVTNNSHSTESFYFSWASVAAGTYTLTAVATDSGGTMATSAPVNITVTNVPLAIHFVYPTNNESYAAPAIIGLNVSVSDSAPVRTVQYFAGTNSLGTVTDNSHSTESFYFSWAGVAAGTYTLTAVATDSGGTMATSAPVNITVTNVPLTISLVSPANGQKFAAPANIGINSTVSGSLSVKTVQYFAGATSIGTLTNPTVIPLSPMLPPYGSFYLLWTNVAAGTYTLTAVATDSSGVMATSAPVNITVTNVPLTISLVSPANGQKFAAPANIGINSRVSGSFGVTTVQYFAGATSIGTVTNPTVPPPPPPIAPSSQSFYLLWSNVVAGTYTLTAVATDSSGVMATSAPVNITVTNVPLSISISSPNNGQTFLAPANIGISSKIADSVMVKSVQYFAGAVSIGTVSNLSSGSSSFYLVWSNVASGSYALRAVAADAGGNMATSAPVNITVTNVPLTISMWYPSNQQVFVSPANVGVHARVADSQVILSVQYFAGTNAIGAVTNTNNVVVTSTNSSNPFFFDWTNVPSGTYALTAVATDAGGVMATSAPVTIVVVSTLPQVVTIYAPDPVAIEGTNTGLPLLPPFTNSFNGTNTATFVVQRTGGTAGDLLVFYTIGGTASNGVAYALIPNTVTIPAGQTHAVITIIPLPQTTMQPGFYETVILTLTPSPAASPLPSYYVGVPSAAEAIILEDVLPVTQPGLRILADSTVHVSAPGTDGMPYCVQISSDLVNWAPVCTNTAVNGSVQFIDPNGPSAPNQFYRIVPVAAPATY
jgi:hypothetical protein